MAGQELKSFVMPGQENNMEAFLVSTGIVALAEIGDKTQLLAFILAAKFRRPLPIILGMLVSTLFNHGFAAAVGAWVTTQVGPGVLRWLLGFSFLAMALWTLVPDRFDEADAKLARLGVFGATAVAFFMAEMGDKTQVAAIALAARYRSTMAVIAGTTLGMMIANVPAVLMGERMAGKISTHLMHRVAAALFAVLGVATLLFDGASFGL